MEHISKLTKEDLKDAPITVDDMLEYVKIFYTDEIYEHKGIMNMSRDYQSEASLSEAELDYAEYQMRDMEMLQEVELWILNNKKYNYR